MEYASRIIGKATDFVVDVSVRQLGYIIRYKKNVDELQDCVKDLELERERVKHQVDEAKNNVKEIEAKVSDWIEKVDKTIIENNEFQNDEGHTKTRSSRGSPSYLLNRHRLGRKAKKMVADVKLLIDKSNFDGVSYQQNPTSINATFSNAGYEEFASRRCTMEKIMTKLEDSTVRMIGVYGPGGVGKTTLVKEIAKKARDKNLFTVVGIVDITDNPNPQKIQEDIAYVLGLQFEGEGETGRADRLRRRLKQEKENTLIILDDLWSGLDLNKLGIPLDNDDDDDLSQMTVKRERDFKTKEGNSEKDFGYKMVKKEKSPGDYKGCKILLTSRFKEVLSDKMNVQEDSILPVTELNDEEAVALFKKVAEIQDGNSEFNPEIVKKYCVGLPMAIVAVGRALRHKSESVWEDAVEKLTKHELMGVQKSMEFSVKMSYDHLESEELKSIFLICARMGHQSLIMDLVKYCFGLGILKGVHTLRDARDRISASIQKLKDSSLMLDGDSSDHFNMHDMVREAALSIAHKEENVFTLRNDKLDDWPDKDELERCTAISIHNSDIVDRLPKVMNCPQLRVFHIDSDDPSLEIPDRFFEGMEKIRVLILTAFHLACLPSSIKCLSNLRMLCLEQCVLGDLSIIGDLKNLRILSLSGSQIENLPAQLGGLGKLQLLDISDCSIGKVIPHNFISSLSNLEELYIRKSLIEKKVEGETNQSLITILAELRHLHQLTCLDICIPSAAIFPRSLFFDKLNDYKIVIGDLKMLSIGDFKMPNKFEASRSLVLQLKDGTDIHSHNGIKMLFKRVENLLLGELNGVQNAFYELNLDGFPDLKHLSIINNLHIEYIINSLELSHPQDAFPNLESLSLYKVRNIKMICCSQVTDVSFNKLRTIKVKLCTQLKNLFSLYMVKFLASLETIDVSECDYLEEIVHKETQTNTEKVELQKLRSLTLQFLPSFSSFYTNAKMQATNSDHLEITTARDEHSVTTSLSLFDNLVEIPNLESLKLSSISIHKIWSDQPSSSFCFQNLIKLTIKDCGNLRYLCSLSMASSLKKLKGLFVSECRMMEKIFVIEGNGVDSSKVCIFPMLEEIQLTNMNMLEDMWEAEVSADSFSRLTSVQINGCRKLKKIFPSHMVGRFGSLDSLKVVNCQSVKAIFEFKDSPQIDAFGIDTKIRLIHLSMLPKLKHVWNRDPRGMLNFKNLRSIQVTVCDELKNVLPASVAEDLEKLEDFLVQYCDEIKEIVAWEEGSETNNKPLVFPEVTYMGFVKLPKIKRFYKGRHIVECPKLKRLAVSHCKKLKTFTTEAKPVFSAKKVISNLEYMEIDLKEAKWLQNNIGKYRMHHLKELCLRSLPSIKILYWFLHRIPNLERLILRDQDSDQVKTLVPRGNNPPQEKLGTVLHLKQLTLFCTKIEKIGFERDPVLQRVERLVLLNCYSLVNLAHSSVSFTHLTSLEVGGCKGLINLMASSTAKSLVQLTTMKVIYCENIMAIVTNGGNEKDRVVDVVFSKLITLELVGLKKLTSFCSYKNCEFKFPSLEILIVRECPKMKTFTEGRVIAPKLRNILALEGEEEEKWSWEGDLNATIQKVFTDKVTFEYTEDMHLSTYYPALEQVWHGNDFVQENCFRNLRTLKVTYYENLVNVIPSHLLPCFKNLEELEVRSCNAVEVIFNVNDTKVKEAMGIFRLKKLSLIELPKLEHVWDEDPKGIFGLQVLQDVHVDECNSLKNLFPASVAKDLARLEKLRVTNCTELVGIFAKVEKDTKGAAKEFVFHCLTSLELRELPRFRYFLPGEQVLISIEKVIRTTNAKKFSFRMGNTMIIWHPQFRKLEFNKSECFQEESDSVLYRFLHMVPSIGKLKVTRSSLEEIFSRERPNVDYTGIHSHLKELKLYGLWNLKSIGLEHHCPENLVTLGIGWCDCLIHLVPCTVSFSNLTFLAVSDCNSLLYLFTSSTAKSLAQLKLMAIRDCESMQEVVSEDDDESHQDEKIIFGQLQALYLENLPMLRCFYLGNFTLCFPSLEGVYVIECHKMKTFCPISITNPTKWRWEGDLNTTMHKTIEEEVIVDLSEPVYETESESETSESESESGTSESETSESDDGTSEEIEEEEMPETESETDSQEAIEDEMSEVNSPEVIEDEEMSATESQANFKEVIENEEMSEALSEVDSQEVIKDEEMSETESEVDSREVIKNEEMSETESEVDSREVMEDEDMPEIESEVNTQEIGEFTCGLQDLSLEDHQELQAIWHGFMPIPDMCFTNLKSLIVDGCEFLSDVLIPSHLLPFLTKLERLEVRNCIFIKNIFDVKCIKENRKKINMGLAVLPLHFSLKELILEDLPKLKNVWNEDPDKILRVQLLQEVYVDTCKCLSSLFPASVAKDLVKLENLVVRHCGRLMAIIADDELAPTGSNLDFTFPCLTSLSLLDLPKLEFLYFSLQCFKDEICIQKVTPNLQCLSVGEKARKIVWHGKFQGNLFPKIKDLVLDGFNIESNEHLYGFLQKVPNIEKLMVSGSSFEEFFSSEKPNVDYIGFLSQLKGLKLDFLPELISIGLEHSWVEDPFLKNLETLEVISCSKNLETLEVISCSKNLETLEVISCSLLRNIVSSPVCFSNLMNLTVAHCDELRYLFTSPTAKSLARLKQMDISWCESIQEIVSKEEDESHHNEMVFGQLQMLKLEELPNLKSFYEGSFTLSFPSLEHLSLFYCHKMETFCSGAINANKLSAIKFNKYYGDSIPLEVDLNSTIRKEFQTNVHHWWGV